MSMSKYASREDWAEAMGYDAGKNALMARIGHQ